MLAGQCGTSEAWCRTRKALAYRLCLSTPSGSGRPLKLGAAPLMYSMSAWCGEALARSAGRRAPCARLQEGVPVELARCTEIRYRSLGKTKSHFWQKTAVSAREKVSPGGSPVLGAVVRWNCLPTSAAGCNVWRCCFSRHSARRGACRGAWPQLTTRSRLCDARDPVQCRVQPQGAPGPDHARR